MVSRTRGVALHLISSYVPLSARSHLDGQLLSFVERVLMGISYVPRSSILSGHGVARRHESGVLVLLSECEVGLTYMHVMGNWHERGGQDSCTMCERYVL